MIGPFRLSLEHQDQPLVWVWVMGAITRHDGKHDKIVGIDYNMGENIYEASAKDASSPENEEIATTEPT